MSNYRIAVRYAKSLMQLSIENKNLEVIMKDMAMINKICQENRAFQVFLKNPIIHSYKKSGILKKIFEGKVNKTTFLFIELITRKTREDILPEIAEEFMLNYRKYMKIEVVDVITPIEIDKSLIDEFTKLAHKYVGEDKTIQLNKQVDQELIGGFVMKVDGKQLDDSVSSQLREVKKKLIVS